MNSKLLTGLSLFLMLSVSAKAQTADRQVYSSTGGSYSGAALSADYTCGEAATASGSSGSFILSQGFQQPTPNGTGIPDPDPATVNWQLYPNPADQRITLELNSSFPATLRLSLSGVNGQTLQREAELLSLTGSLKKEIDISGLPGGIYFLLLHNSEGRLVQRIKFQKQ